MIGEILAYVVLPSVVIITIKIAKQNSSNASAMQREDSIKQREIDAKIREFELLVKKEQIKAETLNKSPISELSTLFPVSLLDNKTKSYLNQEQIKLMRYLSQVHADYDQEMRVRNMKIDKWILHSVQKEN